MQKIPESGFYITNKLARVALLVYEEVTGRNGINAVLNIAGLSHLINNYPPDTMDKKFDFADFTAIHVGLEELYGSRGGRGLALRAGRATFADVRKTFGPMAGVTNLAFRVLPLQTKIHFVLNAAARLFSTVSDQLTTVSETDDALIWTVHRCPSCWSRTGLDRPVCFPTTGMLNAMLHWVSQGLEFRVNESRCKAMGDSVCEFIIQKEPISS